MEKLGVVGLKPKATSFTGVRAFARCGGVGGRHVCRTR